MTKETVAGAFPEEPMFRDPLGRTRETNIGFPPFYMTKTDEKLGEEMAESMRIPLKAGDSRRHHFIPQFFLRGFANVDLLARVPLEDPQQCRIAKVKDVAVVKDLYTIVDGDPNIGATVSVERLLARIDDDAVTPLKCLAGLGLIFTRRQPERLALALWLSMLSVRVPAQRRLWEALLDLSTKAEMAHSNMEDKGFSQSELEKEMRKRLTWLKGVEVVTHQNEYVRRMLNLGQTFALYIHSRRWLVFKFTKPGLVLTDNPVVNLPPDITRLLGYDPDMGMAKYVPIDRSTALVIHNNSRLPEKTITDHPGVNVDYLNQVLVDHAALEVYCHPKDLRGLQRLRIPDPTKVPLLDVSGGDEIAATVDGINAAPKRRRPRRYRKL